MKRIFLLMFFAIFLLSTNSAAQGSKQNKNQTVSLKEPQAVDPVSGILKLFESRSLVALDEGGHRTAQTNDFFKFLVQDPRLAGKVNDIVVEFGTSKYQDVLDRYIYGERVPLEQLQMVWRETSQILLFDNPIYRQFFETVRRVNSRLPKNRKMRVLLGDPPVDWTKINDFTDWMRQANRDTSAARIIEREVLKKGRKAILIYGGTHLVRRDVYRNFEPTPGDFAGVVEQIERLYPNSTYVVWSNTGHDDIGVAESRQELFPIPSLIMLKGTTLGDRDFTSVLSKEDGWGQSRIKFVDGNRVNVPKEEFAKFKLEDNVDALLYLGPVKYLYEVPYLTDTFADENYYRESVRRSKILNETSLSEIENLRKQFLSDKKP